MELFSAVLFLSLLLVSCVKSSEGDVSPQLADADMLVTFSPMLTVEKQTRAVYPTNGEGGMTSLRLQSFGFGVFAQYAGNTAWTSYSEKSTTPFNFMWNQKVSWDGISAWTYSPVKYWPNDNNPADDAGATGSQTHSYLNFFAYAPATETAELPATGRLDATADGIVELSANSNNADASFVYYRTSNEIPFHPDKSVDLLWATNQNCYKYDADDANDLGRIDETVPLVFKHALSRVGIFVKAMIDRTENHTSPAYSTDLDGSSRVFVESATITVPDFYSEGMLMLTPADATPTVPRWDFTGLDAKKQTDISLNTSDISYALRYDEHNIPTNRNWDGKDPSTDLYDYEQAKEDFDAMETGVTASERQLAAMQQEFMFPPAGTSKAITFNIVYDVITYDKNLVLNNPKYYSVVQNNITATLPSALTWESNKVYKLLMELGLTTAKFSVVEVTEWGEVIVLSSIVKEWDIVTREVNVE